MKTLWKSESLSPENIFMYFTSKPFMAVITALLNEINLIWTERLDVLYFTIGLIQWSIEFSCKISATYGLPV